MSLYGLSLFVKWNLDDAKRHYSPAEVAEALRSGEEAGLRQTDADAHQGEFGDAREEGLALEVAITGRRPATLQTEYTPNGHSDMSDL